MKTILTALTLLSLCSCKGEVNNRNLIENAYEFNLRPFLKEHKYQMKGGLIVVSGIESDSKILEKVIRSDKKKSKAAFYHKKLKVTKPSWGMAVYSKWSENGGVTQYAVYYAKPKVLLLGYFSGMDEY